MQNSDISAPGTWKTFVEEQAQEDYPLSKPQLSALEKLFSDPEASVTAIARQLAQPTLEKLQENPNAPVDEFRLWRTIEYVNFIVQILSYLRVSDGISGDRFHSGTA